MPEVVESSFESLDGARLWYAVYEARGDSTVLLCSGGPGCCDYLAPLALMLDDACRTVRFDARGCGRSTRTGPYTVEANIDDLEALRLHLGVPRWSLIGHSAGGDLALAYALEHPHSVDRLICVAGGRIHNDRDWRKVYEWNLRNASEVLPEMAYPYNPQVNERVSASWRRYCTAPDLLQRIAALPMPVHYVLAAEDIRPNWPLEQIAALAPCGVVHRIAGAAHNIWLTHAAPLRQILREVLELTH